MAMTDGGQTRIKKDPAMRIETRIYIVIQTATALAFEALLLILAYFKTRKIEKENHRELLIV